MLSIVKCHEKGVLKKERIELIVKKSCNLSSYILFDSTYNEDGVPSDLDRHNFWFPDIDVIEGDKVFVYTKDGSYNKKRTESGNLNHFLYWGVGATIWNEDGDMAIIVKKESKIYTKV